MSRPAVYVAAGLVLLLVVGVVVAAIVLDDSGTAEHTAKPTTPPRTGPVALVPVEAPSASTAECTTLLTTLPKTLTSGETELTRLPIADPAPPGALAWGSKRADPLVLRCGLNRPGELVSTSGLREISGVKWLPVDGDGAVTWFVVDRPVYVALTVPDRTGTGPLQEISEVVASSLTAKQVEPAG